MRKLTKLFAAILFAFSYQSAFAQSQVLPPIQFNGGVDFDRPCTDIADSRACNGENMLPDSNGTLAPRNGTKQWISQSVSTEPFSALYVAYIATGTKTVRVVTGVSGDSIYISTLASPAWKKAYSGLYTRNQQFSFAVARGLIYMTGDALTDPIFRYDVLIDSFAPVFLGTVTTSANFYAKYLLYTQNYMIAANIRDVRDLALTNSSTYYDDRFHYSGILEPSSFTATRFESISSGDGDMITGVTDKFGKVEFYKQNSIHELSFTNLDLVGAGGDQAIVRIVSGYGNIMTQSPESFDDFDIMFSKDGLIRWDGGRRSRLNIQDERLIQSRNVQDTLRKLVREKKYKNAMLRYYAKRNWLIFSYEHPERFPKGRQNSVLICNLLTGEWYPQRNLLMASASFFDGPGDTGEMIFGDSMDGRVHLFDQETRSDDIRNELSMDTMDSSATWVNAVRSTDTVIEGTGSLKLVLHPSLLFSSMSKVSVFPLGEWHDKSRTSKEDKLSFKVYAASIGNIQNLRIDLQIDNEERFTTEFSSVVISSFALTAGNTAWSTIEIALSSFPVKSEWLALSSETVAFSRSLTIYGIRFVSTAVGGATLYFDDIRFVQKSSDELAPVWITKQFNLGSMADKDFRQIILTREKSPDTELLIDVLTGVGKLKNTIKIKRDIEKEIYIFGFNGTNGLAKVNSSDYEPISSTITANFNILDLKNGVADKRFVYTSNDENHSLIKFDKNNLTVFTATFGSLGEGTSNFKIIHQIALDTKDDGKVYVIDYGNNRLKVHDKRTLQPIRVYGELGTGTTNLHAPTGVTVAGDNIFIGDDGNDRLVKLSIDTFAFISKSDLDINTMGEISLANDGEFLYAAYNKLNDKFLYFQDVVLEKRTLGNDMSLLNRIIIRPLDNVELSTWTLRPDIGLSGKYIFVSFTNDVLTNDDFYVQKLLKSDFSVVSEYKSKSPHYGVAADGLASSPIRSYEAINLKAGNDKYAQLKFYGLGLDNNFKLYSMAFVVEPKEFSE